MLASVDCREFKTIKLDDHELKMRRKQKDKYESLKTRTTYAKSFTTSFQSVSICLISKQAEAVYESLKTSNDELKATSNDNTVLSNDYKNRKLLLMTILYL